ncbi:rhomboid family protein [Fimbriimonas ginsengisoli]|uniref:Regulatory protein IclR n=1 Tax=Fimbriimonas ginsengisoli Gsoil 348 TaxID=661478 RepID=A0A068NMS2_FIMGI|nr:rhomboid family intramembrane serine protease [Fimbriimonas ginsengisoli]AIE84692.1 regulatory protein IclR [Fimbriimonas ginsengisoli Gsoil 348]
MIERRVPIVTLILIGANLVAAFALIISPSLAEELGFNPARPRLSSAVTGLFLHANLFHLLGNMVFLAAVGAAVELATGSLRFALVYFFAGLCGVAVHYLVTRGTQSPASLVGASGAIAGCAAYYSVRYTGLKVAFAPHRALSVAAVTGIWVILQVVGAFVRVGQTEGGTSYWAHLGGFAGGVLLSLLFRAPDLGQIRLGHEVLEQMNDRGPGAVVTAATRHLEKHPRDLKALWELANAQRLLGEGEAEADVLLRLLEIESEEEVPEVLRRLCQAGRVTRLPTLRRLQLADRIRLSSPAIAKALLRSVVEGERSEPQRPDAILSLATLERDESPVRAEELLGELSSEYPMHPAAELARKRGWIG